MAENCSISYTEAFAMDELEIAFANAALDKYNVDIKKANAKGGKK
ncbi:hypothetical protein [Metabacillus idriensis]|nr:hypothetical protein [Metabacillus idriensis]